MTTLITAAKETSSLLASKKSKNTYRGKMLQFIRWPSHRVIALQVVRTSFLGPRPRLFPPLAQGHCSFLMKWIKCRLVS